jgi:hypothetical protein
VIATAVSDLTGIVYFHWYLDGVYMGVSRSGVFEFSPPPGEQFLLRPIDTNNAAFDPITSGPGAPPQRMTLHWHPPADTDVDHYEVYETLEDVAPVTTLVAKIPHDDGVWLYTYLSPRFRGAGFSYEIRPVDRAGNVRDPGLVVLEFAPSIQAPLAPNWTFTFDEGTTRVTFLPVIS